MGEQRLIYLGIRRYLGIPRYLVASGTGIRLSHLALYESGRADLTPLEKDHLEDYLLARLRPHKEGEP